MNLYLFRLEWRSGQWQRSRVAVKDPFNAILSILLQLFYDSKSEWLTRLVEKGIDIVHLEESDERAKVCDTVEPLLMATSLQRPQFFVPANVPYIYYF